MKKKKRSADISSMYEMIKIAEDDVTTTYSAIMRNLRKNDPDKLKAFMKAFKEAFDQANSEKLDDVESVALLQALQHIDLEKSDDTKDV
ncbi:MAG TPA: hypothetical protein VM577_14210 [Anaerovoracaceae bacterium]|nr:hypothetical protein [Anaerovoracaceae bacterium]